MISIFLLKLLDFLFIARYFGGSALIYKKNKMVFSNDPKVQRKALWGFYLCLLWIGLSSVILLRFYGAKDFDQLNQDFPFWLFLGLLGTGYCINGCFSHDFCLLANGIFHLLPEIHRKYKLIDL